jgi:hypothetical protein
MGKVTIAAGDLVIGDRDGVVVVPRRELAEVTGAWSWSRPGRQRCMPRWPPGRSGLCSMVDPDNTSVMLRTLQKAASTLGRRLRLDLAQYPSRSARDPWARIHD